MFFSFLEIKMETKKISRWAIRQGFNRLPLQSDLFWQQVGIEDQKIRRVCGRSQAMGNGRLDLGK